MHCLSLQACRIAKLFSKHIKVPEQQQHLDSHAVGIGCGTPNRLLKLADIDALKLDRLRLLLLDVQLDAKQRWTFSYFHAPTASASTRLLRLTGAAALMLDRLQSLVLDVQPDAKQDEDLRGHVYGGCVVQSLAYSGACLVQCQVQQHEGSHTSTSECQCRTTLSMPETAGDFWMLVSKHIAPLLPGGNVKIVLLDQSKWPQGAQ